ncbi:hypothetical protein VNO77_03877 [Canavalia gladiata]|uniref:Uncharacterized protein n=1 Tax=Canavalia gladiata TaxID=3824 RepID=A0AAN9N1Z0_CANGL
MTPCSFHNCGSLLEKKLIESRNRKVMLLFMEEICANLNVKSIRVNEAICGKPLRLRPYATRTYWAVLHGKVNGRLGHKRRLVLAPHVSSSELGHFPIRLGQQPAPHAFVRASRV